MHHPALRAVALLASFCAVAASRGAVQANDYSPGETQATDSERVYVLDWAARAITVLDRMGRPLSTVGYGPESVARRGPFSRTALITFNTFYKDDEGTPAEMILSPRAGRLVVLDHGPGKDTRRFGWHPARRSAVVVFRSPALRAVAAIDGVWGLPTLQRLSPDGRYLTLVGPGYRSQNQDEERPSELVRIDLGAGTLAGRFDLTGRIPAATNWEEWLDTNALSADGQYLYLLDRGRPSGDPDGHRDGRVLVVSATTGEVVNALPAGTSPRALVVDEEGSQVLLLSDHRPLIPNREALTGELRIIRGDAVAATIAVAPNPLFLRVSPDRSSIHVFSTEALTTIDAVSLQRTGGVLVKRAGISWAAPTVTPAVINDATISLDGRRAYVVHEGSSRLSIVDLEAQRVAATVTTGRTSRKVRLELTAAAASALSRWSAEQQARSLGHRWYVYTTYYVLPARTSVAVSPDGRFAYVANTQTKDVTVIDTTAAQVVRHIGVPGVYLQMLPNSDLLAVGHSQDVQFIDTRTNTMRQELRLKGQHHTVTASPDGSRVFVLSKGQLTSIEPRSGESARFSEFMVPTQVLFDSSPAPDEGGDAVQPDPFQLETSDGILPATRWMILHLHRATKCQGWLYLTETRIGFRSESDDDHSWEIPLDEVKEVEANRTMGGGGKLGSFHVALDNGDNYNFSLNGIPADRLVEQLAVAVAKRKQPRS